MANSTAALPEFGSRRFVWYWSHGPVRVWRLELMFDVSVL